MLHITTHGGKLEGMHSISTSVKLNPNCQERARISGSVCAHCYAASLTACRKGLADAIARNTEELTRGIIPAADLPIINDRYFRLEAFGDLINSTQVINYFNLCRKNRGTRFALWTKNPRLIAQAIDGGAVKPSNLIIIFSSTILNRPVAGHIVGKYPFIDKVFTVYTKDSDAHINCGGNHCLSCLRCYNKRTSFYVNERLK